MEMEDEHLERAWWQTGVSSDHQATVGWSMIRTVLVWLAVVVVLVVVGVVVIAIT